MQTNIFSKLKTRDNTTSKPYTYKDVFLDFTINETGKDILASFDYGAIRNSIINILNTRPGQNFLFPDFGLRLEGQLFEAITEANGNYLGKMILLSIEKYEPRVRVESIGIDAYTDENQYDITIRLFIPSANKYIDIGSSITADGVFI